jgi:small subunit ribosomal protein S5
VLLTFAALLTFVCLRLQVFVEAMSNQSLPHDGVEGTGVYMREVFAKKLPCGLQRGVDVP